MTTVPTAPTPATTTVTHILATPQKIHRDGTRASCDTGPGCARRHRYIIKCSCGHEENRGRLKYTRDAITIHLQEEGQAPA